MYILTTASVTSKSPLEAAARAGLTGSDWCPAEPKKATGRPTRRAQEAPVTNNREQYSTRSAAAQEKGEGGGEGPVLVDGLLVQWDRALRLRWGASVSEGGEV
ncbi:YCF36, putative [Actinidia rufa]|uniref:YCF36, putative n=1 Tax=Actinidia rufa TaxID=165716 RepID=A0A7J0GCJ9_9ERIC|nr:YCF36, putative [Actinidia rufa]